MAGFTRILVLFLAAAGVAEADDWPTWRHDASRSATTSEALPPSLHPVWVRDFKPNLPAWPEDVRLQFDAAYEPVVSGKTLFLASARTDSVTAIHTDTGRTLWRTFVNGPVRFAPTVVNGRVYFGCDDGFLYCLEAKRGSVLWKLCPRPGRKILGNDRLSSVWPVRGAPVHADGKLYLTAGVWPFEGVFLYVVDLSAAPAGGPPPFTVQILKSTSPQGYLAVGEDRLLVPNGRGRAVMLDRASGSPRGSSASSKGKTDTHVLGGGTWVFHGSTGYNWETRLQLPAKVRRPVVEMPVLYAASGDAIRAYDLTTLRETETVDRRGRKRKSYKLDAGWTLKAPSSKADPLQVFLKAGGRLYGSGGGNLFAVDIPGDGREARVSWEAPVKGLPASMIAADGKLFVVTRDGKIHCFGAEAVAARPANGTPSALLKPSEDEWGKRAEAIVKETGVREGFAVVLGIGSGRLIEELLARTDLRVIGIDGDAKRVDSARKRLVAADLYGTRVSVLEGDPIATRLPPYLANLVVSERLDAPRDARTFKAAFRLLRPYGGKACLDGAHDLAAAWVGGAGEPQARLSRQGNLTILSREGALPGSSNWTHEYSGPANSLMSSDALVKTPLGLLWYGGPSADGSLYYDRHDWGPSMLVIEGRMFIQGPGKLTAVDVYTGRILWQNEIPEGRTEGRRGNFDAVGRHLLVVKDGLYVAYPKECLRLDPATGKIVSRLTLEGKDEEFGRIRVVGDKLVAAVFKTVEGKGKQPVAMRAMDRRSGKVLWNTEAKKSFPFAAIGGGKVYAFDGHIEALYKDWKRKGLVPKAEAEKHVRAFDLETGEESWSVTGDLVTTWMSYSEKHDVLMTSNKKGMVAYRGANGSVLWSKEIEGRGFRGHPESVWDKVILRHDRVIDQRGPGGAYNILTGEVVTTPHPVTGKPVPWKFTKIGHHCNYAIASEHLMTFRAQEAGFLDLKTGGTSRLSGFRSGCRNSLIPANGVLNAPNFAHGCVCDYNVFTSLAFIHTPGNEKWSYTAYAADDSPIRSVGINLGAPGSRRAAGGTYWTSYPRPASSTIKVPVQLSTSEPKYFRVHATQMSGEGLRWVAASGVAGVTKLAVTVSKERDAKPRAFTVKLYFSEPEAIAEGARVFDVSLQREPVLKGFDVIREAGVRRRSIVREFKGVSVGRELVVELGAVKGAPILSGVELVAED